MVTHLACRLTPLPDTLPMLDLTPSIDTPSTDSYHIMTHHLLIYTTYESLCIMIHAICWPTPPVDSNHLLTYPLLIQVTYWLTPCWFRSPTNSPPCWFTSATDAPPADLHQLLTHHLLIHLTYVNTIKDTHLTCWFTTPDIDPSANFSIYWTILLTYIACSFITCWLALLAYSFHRMTHHLLTHLPKHVKTWGTPVLVIGRCRHWETLWSGRIWE